MPVIKFTSNLKRFYPDLKPVSVTGSTVAEILEQINKDYNGIKDYVVDERGALRKHVNIFIGNDMIKDRVKLRDDLGEEDEVCIMQALSGG
ncbi:MAG: MoaD/ThiS family protein [Bacteroidota bacterium]